MSAIYLQADTAHGITVFDWADVDPSMDFLSLEEFAKKLEDLDDDEVIRTIAVHEGEPTYLKLKEDYGIRNSDGSLID